MVYNKKVLVVTNILSPYRVPLFNKLVDNYNFDLTVCALAESEENRHWDIKDDKLKFNFEVVPGFHYFLWEYELPIHINYGLYKYIKMEKPDILITSGYDQMGYWVSLIYAKIYNKRFLSWCGTNEYTSGSSIFLNKIVKKIFAKQVNAFISHGTKTTDYLDKLGASREKIFEGCNTVDMEKFRNKYLNYKESKKTCRSKKVQYLFVGQLIERKGIKELVEAWPKNMRQIHLHIVGGGPLMEPLNKYLDENNYTNVTVHGYVDRKNLSKYYAQSDILIMPSLKEVWGLVVNEALASGLFVICSEYSGAAHDLITDGINGITINPTKRSSISQSIKETAGKIEQIRAEREEISRHAVKKFSIDTHVEAFGQAINMNDDK